MKTFLTALVLMQTFVAVGGDNRVLLPPFENLSSRRAPAEYLISAGGLSERAPSRNMVDRYSHIPREILEDIVSQIKGVQPVERQRLDQFFLENGLGQTFVDGEKAKRAMIKLGTPTAVQGTVLSVYEQRSTYDGYVKLVTHRWTARVRVRIYHLVGGNLDIPFSRIVHGSYEHIDTPNTQLTVAEEEVALAVLTDALGQLREDEKFIAAVSAGVPHSNFRDENDGLIQVPVDVLPKGADVYVDDVFVGQTPCTLPLKSDQPVVVRIEKSPTYETWQAKIVPRARFRLTRELTVIATPDAKGTK